MGTSASLESNLEITTNASSRRHSGFSATPQSTFRKNSATIRDFGDLNSYFEANVCKIYQNSLTVDKIKLENSFTVVDDFVDLKQWCTLYCFVKLQLIILYQIRHLSLSIFSEFRRIWKI